VSLAIRRGHRAAEITAAARTITQRAPVTLTLVRQRAQPTAETIVRLAVTAVFAYLVALLIPGTSRPVLAPLTALLVVQVSIYQRLRSAVRRVASVVAGVLTFEIGSGDSLAAVHFDPSRGDGGSPIATWKVN
jgi:hypothetical protein